MRRILLFLFSMMIIIPAIGQGSTYIGNRRQLVVLAAYSDQGFAGDSAQTVEQWKKIFNSQYVLEDPFYGSIREYFFAQSYGQFDLSFDIHYMTLGSMSRYKSTSTSDENSKYLVYDAIDTLKKRVTDWAPYDWDSDGKVDQLMIVFAGKGLGYGGSDMTVRPNQSRISSCDASAVKINNDYSVDVYCCAPEQDKSGGYGSFGIICHEYSRCFGLPDLKDGTTSYVYTWDVMDYGFNNGSGYRPCGYSSFERAFMGWLTPEELVNPGTYTLSGLQSQPAAFIIRNDAKADEYYLVEYRQKAGWDEKLPGTGILIFHVDYDEAAFKFGKPNTSSRQRYLIFAANNQPECTSDNVKGWTYPKNGNNSLTNTSVPAAELFNANTADSLFMSKPITEMSVSKSMGVASLRFNDLITGVGSFDRSGWAKDNSWFTIDGRRLEGKPEKQGLYIRNGKVFMIK
jgi:M6 family metalloprotease-like protein